MEKRNESNTPAIELDLRFLSGIWKVTPRRLAGEYQFQIGLCNFTAGGREQPFYQVLVDGRDRADSTTYVAECNIEVRSFIYDPQWKARHQLAVQHEKVRLEG